MVLSENIELHVQMSVTAQPASTAGGSTVGSVSEGLAGDARVCSRAGNMHGRTHTHRPAIFSLMYSSSTPAFSFCGGECAGVCACVSAPRQHRHKTQRTSSQRSTCLEEDSLCFLTMLGSMEFSMFITMRLQALHVSDASSIAARVDTLREDATGVHQRGGGGGRAREQ